MPTPTTQFFYRPDALPAALSTERERERERDNNSNKAVKEVQ